MRIRLLSALLGIMIFASCSTSHKQNLTYFKDLDATEDGSLSGVDYNIKIGHDDELFITVNSLVPEATIGYNLPLTNPATRGTATSTVSQAQQQTYVVDKNGDIIFPILGKIKVEGLSVTEIRDMLTHKISEAVKDPVVRVELVNFKVNVLGEVKTPRTIDVPSERYSVLDALAAAGDLTEYGRRENILLIREENGVKTYHRLNLADGKVLSSPYFYLKQNDVIYVEPNKIRTDNSKYNQNNAFKLSVVATIVSACSVVASLIIALVAK